ncbi:MAG: hypothetical protein HC862_19020 [Scytonema sp. RU_4_4]|nr:hypothetical protein [Scytonema sp. RU_4_4]NJR75481.1 hypothetical protein [Scytonema sp. CRU_2_7]
MFPPQQKRTHKSKLASLKQKLGKSPVQHFSRQKLVALRSYQHKFLSYTGEQLSWLQVISRVAGTVVPAVLGWVLLCGVYGIFISLLNYFGYLSFVQEVKALPNIAVALNVALSLLLAFRTNTAHERFWEGRKLWGAMVNTVRNLARGIWLTIEERQPTDRKQKEASMRLVSSFAVAMKLHLRRDPMNLNDELKSLMSQPKYCRIQQVNHGPLEISFWLGDYLQHQYEREHLNVFQLQDLHKLLNDMVDILGGCERILKTPVPLVYTITLKLLLIAYLMIMPLQLVNTLYWWTGPATAFVSLIFLVINEVGSEIEEPFGHDPNDLPLDFICNTIKRNVEDLIEQATSSRHMVESRISNE